MKSDITTAILLLFALSALTLGLGFAEEINKTANETIANETLENATLTNASLNASLENATLTNATLGNATSINETADNLTAAQNDTNPFGNVKGRQPTHR